MKKINKKEEQIIYVVQTKIDRTILLINNVFFCDAFIGKKGTTKFKVEGDLKTPEGIFEIGTVFGIHERNEINLDKSIKYVKLNENIYFVDDVNSRYYNQMVDITKIDKDFITAEHLIKYKDEYEYVVEIKTNPNNIPLKGSAIFLHCSAQKATLGCVAVPREKIIELLKLINNETKICIKGSNIKVSSKV